MEVYIEYVIIDNLVIDYLLLKSSLRITRVQFGFLRVLLSAILGTAVAVLLPLTGFTKAINFLIKILLAFVLVALAGNYKNFIKYLETLNVFVLSTFLVGGLLIATFIFVGIDINDSTKWNYNDFTPVGVTVFGAYLALKVIIKVVDRIYKKRQVFPFTRNCKILIGDNHVKAVGYIDSGNRLYDDKSGQPISVISRAFASSLCLSGAISGLNGRYVNFSTASGDGKMLVFKVDKLVIHEGIKDNVVSGALLGVSPVELKDDGDYDILLNPTYFG